MIVVLCSAAGSPGVTTTALGLALFAGGETLLVDVDRDPSQAVLAGWLGGQDPRGRGIVPLVQERATVDQLRSFCLPLTGDGDRAFLPGFPLCANVGLFAAAWTPLARTLAAASARGTLVVVDAGRVGAAGLPPALVQVADRVVLVARSSLRSLAASRLALPGLGEHAARELLMVGAGRPYGLAEAAEAFDLTPLAALPDLPEHAAVLSDAAEEPRRFADGPLVRAYRDLAGQLRDVRAAA